MNTGQVKLAIESELSKYCGAVYCQNAPLTMTEPFLRYDFQSALSDTSSKNIYLVVDVYNFAQDSGDNDKIADAITGDGNVCAPSGLDKLTIQKDGFYVIFYLEQRQSIFERDIQIRRTRLTFTLKIFIRSDL